MPVSDNDSRFRTCCCHVRTCALVIAVLEVLGLLSTMISAMQGHGPQGRSFYASSIAGFVAMLIVVPLLIFGILKEKPAALIPHIVVQVLMIIGCLIGGIAFIILGALYEEKDHDKQEEAKSAKAALIIVGVALLLNALLEIYFTHVIVRCYKYLKEKVGQ